MIKFMEEEIEEAGYDSLEPFIITNYRFIGEHRELSTLCLDEAWAWFQLLQEEGVNIVGGFNEESRKEIESWYKTEG
jgi:hypothetical protein